MTEHRDTSFTETERLFHYTSSTGLFGILQSRCLWATHFRFLNDSKEFYAAKEPLISILGNSIAHGMAAEKVNRGLQFREGFDVRSDARETASEVIERFYGVLLNDGALTFEPYVFSTFSCEPNEPDFANGGLLHWATYGRSGGYAIQINPHKLDKKMKLEGERRAFAYVSNPAIYSIENNLDKVLKGAADAIGQFGRDYAQCLVREVLGEEGRRQPDTMAAIPHFFTLAAIIKDPYFRSEKEARVVAYRPTDSLGKASHAVCIRHAGSTPVPYICLLEDNLLDEDNPIERIIIGPHQDNSRRKLALQTLLQSRKLSNQIEISVSQVPFVGTPF